MKCREHVLGYDVTFNFEAGEPESFDSPGCPDLYDELEASIDGEPQELDDETYEAIIDRLIAYRLRSGEYDD